MLEGKSCEAGVPPACADEVGPHRDLLSVTRSYRCLQLRTPTHLRPPRLRLRCVQGMLSSLEGASPPANPDGGDLPIQAVTPDSGRIRTVVLLAEPLAVEVATGSSPSVVSILFLHSSRAVLPVGASSKVPYSVAFAGFPTISVRSGDAEVLLRSADSFISNSRGL